MNFPSGLPNHPETRARPCASIPVRGTKSLTHGKFKEFEPVSETGPNAVVSAVLEGVMQTPFTGLSAEDSAMAPAGTSHPSLTLPTRAQRPPRSSPTQKSIVADIVKVRGLPRYSQLPEPLAQ
jgi:hypothetical protein